MSLKVIYSGISKLNFMWHFDNFRIYTVAGKCTVDGKDNKEDKTREEADMILSRSFQNLQKWSKSVMEWSKSIF